MELDEGEKQRSYNNAWLDKSIRDNNYLMNGTLNRTYIYGTEKSVVYEEEPSMQLVSDFSELKLQVLSLKWKVENHKIFYSDDYVPPFMHFIEKDKKVV